MYSSGILDRVISSTVIDNWMFSRSDIEREKHLRTVLQLLREKKLDAELRRVRILASDGFVVRLFFFQLQE